MAVFYDARWKDEVLRLESDLEVERDRADSLERQIEVRDKAIEKVAEIQREARPMYKLTKMVLNSIAKDTKVQELVVEGRKEQGEGWILDVYGDNLDQPFATDVKRQAIHESRWNTATFNHLAGLDAQAKFEKNEEVRRAEAERRERERLAAEHAKLRRHLYTDGS